MSAELATGATTDINTLAKELRELRRWLRSTDDILEKLTARLCTQQQGQLSLDELTPAQIIVMLLKDRDEPISLLNLRQEIERHGLERMFGYKFNYFYVLIRRLERNGKIAWEGEGVRLVK